jgi:putative colanic acid biosynthesis UDP-glucose lipid carrier transferase
MTLFLLKKTVLNDPTIKVFKRLFDVVFSTIVIGLFLVDATFGDFNKTESKGPVFF